MQRLIIGALCFMATHLVLAQNTVTLKLSDPCWQTETNIPELQIPEKSFELKIFPNPSRENVTFDISSATTIGVIEIHLVNVQGAIIWRERLFSANSAMRKTIDLQTYPAGVYAVSVLRNGERVSKILVVQ